MKFDTINISIIRHLRDGRVPYRKIAEDLGVSEGTIRSRVKKLQDEGVLEITGLINPDALPDQYVVMVGVRLKDMDLVKKGEEFSRLDGVISVCVVTGRFDLLLTVMLKKQFGMLEFYTNEVSKVENVRSVETFVVYKSFNLKVPLVV
ncbi:Lrp/AsnC family transcriptional regulator [Desulfopila inferna]|uniref:Lrp/AsnC family transcriptional regulator n=1 Tax=Desulfopila inferna TaxID=468528 RepID=UPI001962F5FD|nr:Lrp/AsnC family transcriptional regulator [Desulfopila inferna]MBM9603377.1 Lrp/AsnC family transcriptional regulator [Desulfopila inferna]